MIVVPYGKIMKKFWERSVFIILFITLLLFSRGMAFSVMRWFSLIFGARFWINAFAFPVAKLF